MHFKCNTSSLRVEANRIILNGRYTNLEMNLTVISSTLTLGMKINFQRMNRILFRTEFFKPLPSQQQFSSFRTDIIIEWTYHVSS